MDGLDASAQAIWRTSPYSVRVYAWIHEPEVVFQAQVNQTWFTYPINQVTYDNVQVGAHTDIQAEMTVLFGTTQGGDDLGRQRIRPDQNGVVATASTLNFGRSSLGRLDGEVRLEDNAWITVLNLRQIQATPPFIDSEGVIYKDGSLVFSPTAHQKPVANAGPDKAAFVDGSNEITVDFDGIADSFPTHPDATASLTYAWDFVDGTPATSASAKPTGVVFPKGVRYVSLTVTDSLGNSSTAWALIAAIDEDDLIKRATLMQRKLRADGQTLTLKVDEPIPAATYPDGTEIFLFKAEQFGTTRTALAGVADREDMLFAGWIQQENNQGRATNRGFLASSTLNLVDSAGRLRALPGFPQLVQRDETPGSWFQMKRANADRYIVHLLYWHSNALSRVDFSGSGTGEEYAFPELSSDGLSLYDQVDVLAQAIAHKLTCNVYNQLAVIPDPIIQDEADRTATIIVPIEERDWTSYQYDYTRPPRIHWNWGDAIIASQQDVDTLEEVETSFVVVPGFAPGQGVSSTNTTQQIVRTKAEHRTREGHRYAARMNARYGYLSVDLARMGDAGIDPARMQWVQFSISSATAGPRGRTFSSEKFLPVEVQWNYNPRNGTVRVNVLLEKEVFGDPGVSYTRPTTEQNPTLPGTSIPPVVFPPITAPPLPPPGGGLENAPSLMVLIGEAGIYRTMDFDTPAAQGGPSYFTTTTASLGISGGISNAAPDWYSPKILGAGDGLNAWFATRYGIGLLSDLLGGVIDYDSLYAFATPADAGNRQAVESARLVRDLLAVVTNFQATSGMLGIWSIVSEDGGATWGSDYLIASGYDLGDPERDPGLFIGRSGSIWTAGMESAGYFPPFHGYVSYDHGYTFEPTDLAISGYATPGALHFPWHANAAELICYYGSLDPTVQQPEDFNEDYWLTKPFSVSISYSHSGPTIEHFDEIALERSYPGAVGHLIDSDITGTISYGVGGNAIITVNPQPDSPSASPWLFYANFLPQTPFANISGSGQGVGTHNQTRKIVTRHASYTSGSQIFELFPAYTIQRTGSTFSSAALRAADNLDIRTRLFSFNGSAVVNGTITVRLIIDKTIEAFPGTSVGPRLYRAEGGTRTDITPTDGSGRAYTARHQRSIDTADNNRLRLGLAGCAGTSDDDPTAVFLSDDGGDSWTQVGTIDEAGGRYQGIHIAANGLVYVWGQGGYVGVGLWDSLMAGGDFDNRSGNLPSDTIKLIMGV